MDWTLNNGLSAMQASAHPNVTLVRAGINPDRQTANLLKPAGSQVPTDDLRMNLGIYPQLIIFTQRQFQAEARLSVPKLNTKTEYYLLSVRAGNTAPIAIGNQNSRKPRT